MLPEGSGSLWMHPIALGRAAGSGLVYPELYLYLPQYLYQYLGRPTPLGLLSSLRGLMSVP